MAISKNSIAFMLIFFTVILAIPVKKKSVKNHNPNKVISTEKRFKVPLKGYPGHDNLAKSHKLSHPMKENINEPIDYEYPEDHESSMPYQRGRNMMKQPPLEHGDMMDDENAENDEEIPERGNEKDREDRSEISKGTSNAEAAASRKDQKRGSSVGCHHETCAINDRAAGSQKVKHEDSSKIKGKASAKITERNPSKAKAQHSSKATARQLSKATAKHPSKAGPKRPSKVKSDTQAKAYSKRVSGDEKSKVEKKIQDDVSGPRERRDKVRLQRQATSPGPVIEPDDYETETETVPPEDEEEEQKATPIGGELKGAVKRQSQDSSNEIDEKHKSEMKRQILLKTPEDDATQSSDPMPVSFLQRPSRDMSPGMNKKVNGNAAPTSLNNDDYYIDDVQIDVPDSKRSMNADQLQ